MDKLKITYALYAMELSHQNVKIAATYRFCRLTPFYILVYTDRDKPENAINVEQTETHRLTEADNQWLEDCNTAILAEKMKEHEAEIAAEMMERIERLEKALEAERRNREGDKADGGREENQ